MAFLTALPQELLQDIVGIIYNDLDRPRKIEHQKWPHAIRRSLVEVALTCKTLHRAVSRYLDSHLRYAVPNHESLSRNAASSSQVPSQAVGNVAPDHELASDFERLLAVVTKMIRDPTYAANLKHAAFSFPYELTYPHGIRPQIKQEDVDSITEAVTAQSLTSNDISLTASYKLTADILHGKASALLELFMLLAKNLRFLHVETWWNGKQGKHKAHANPRAVAMTLYRCLPKLNRLESLSLSGSFIGVVIIPMRGGIRTHLICSVLEHSGLQKLKLSHWKHDFAKPNVRHFNHIDEDVAKYSYCPERFRALWMTNFGSSVRTLEIQACDLRPETMEVCFPSFKALTSLTICFSDERSHPGCFGTYSEYLESQRPWLRHLRIEYPSDQTNFAQTYKGDQFVGLQHFQALEKVELPIDAYGLKFHQGSKVHLNDPNGVVKLPSHVRSVAVQLDDRLTRTIEWFPYGQIPDSAWEPKHRAAFLAKVRADKQQKTEIYASLFDDLVHKHQRKGGKIKIAEIRYPSGFREGRGVSVYINGNMRGMRLISKEDWAGENKPIYDTERCYFDYDA